MKSTLFSNNTNSTIRMYSSTAFIWQFRIWNSLWSIKEIYSSHLWASCEIIFLYFVQFVKMVFCFFVDWPSHRLLLGHRGRVTCLLYPYDEDPRYEKEHLVSGGVDFAVKLWDLFSGDLLHTFSHHGGEILRLQCTPGECSVSDWKWR